MRFRRSVKILPGVRINFNKNSTGLTLGPRGAHYTINSSGRRTISTGLPGTGLWWQESYNPNSKKRVAARQAEAETPLYEKDFEDKPKPGFWAKNYENAVFAALTEMDATKFEKVVADYPDQDIFPKFMLVTILVRSAQTGEKGMAYAQEVWSRIDELLKDQTYLKYAPGIKTQMQIVPGVFYVGPYTAHLLGYLLSELYQVKEEYDKSEAILKQISPDYLTPLALLEVNYLQKRYEKVISDSNNPSTDTNENAAKEMYRAMALRETGNFDGAFLLLDEIVKSRTLDKALTFRSRYERALTYLKQGDKKSALADFQFIYAKDSEYLDVKEEIAKLK